MFRSLLHNKGENLCLFYIPNHDGMAHCPSRKLGMRHVVKEFPTVSLSYFKLGLLKYLLYFNK